MAKTNLKIVVDKNVMIINFIDSLSRWDYFVSEHIYEYYKDKYGISTSDEASLNLYAEIRKSFGWQSEIELFEWAYGGFQTDSKFAELIGTIDHFKSNKTLMSEIDSAYNHILKIKQDILLFYEEKDIRNIVELFSGVFDISWDLKEIPAFLTYSPLEHSTQGGANGDGIYTQVPNSKDTDLQILRAGSTLFHEFLHKAIHPGTYFKARLNKDGFYSSKKEDIYPDEFSSFVEEVIVYSLSNVITFRENPDDRIKNYEKKLSDTKRHFEILWSVIKEAVPVLESFMRKELNKEGLLQKLDKLFRKYKSATEILSLSKKNLR